MITELVSRLGTSIILGMIITTLILLIGSFFYCIVRVFGILPIILIIILTLFFLCGRI